MDLQLWKKLEVIKKKFLRKKSFQFIFANKIFKTLRNFFKKINELRDINFWWFYRSEKLFFTTKLIKKREQQKIEKIPHTILEKIISQTILQNFCKTGLNPKELGLLE